MTKEYNYIVQEDTKEKKVEMVEQKVPMDCLDFQV